MSDFESTLAAINRAVGCQECGRGLGASVSDDFCSQGCQTDWHAARSEPLVGYREPYDLFAHFSNQVELDGQIESARSMGAAYLEQLRQNMHSLQAQRLPVIPVVPHPDAGDIFRAHEQVRAAFQRFSDSVGDLRQSMAALQTTFRQFAEAASPRPQPAIIRNLASLADTPPQRWRLSIDPSTDLDSSTVIVAIEGPHGPSTIVLDREELLTRTDPVGFALQRLYEEARPATTPVETAQQRALRLRQNRNTGPQQRERAPQRIDARRSR